SQGVVGETDELIVILGVGAEPSGADGHTVLGHAVQTGLGTVGLGEVVDKLLGGGGEVQLLGAAPEGLPGVEDLFLGGLFVKAGEDGGYVAVGGGHPEALGGEGGGGGVDDDALLLIHMAPQFEGLPLALLFLAADVG